MSKRNSPARRQRALRKALDACDPEDLRAVLPDAIGKTFLKEPN